MKKQTLFTLIICLFAHTVMGQDFLSIEGKVTEKQSGEAISYATISVKNQAIGTVTNTQGSFVFHIPKKYKNDSLVVSSIGYKSYTIKISEIANKKLNIRLEPKVYDLSEVEVKPKNALEIVKQAIAKIPENYPTQPINMDGFYREMTFENDTCVEMAEAACEFYYSSYTMPFNFTKAANIFLDKTNDFNDYYWQVSGLELPPSLNDKYKIIESRTSKLNHKNRFKVVPRGAALTLTVNDEVKYKYHIFNKKVFKKYKFFFDDITTYDGRSVYIISFLDDAKIKISGKLYIDIQTLAIIAYQYNMSGKWIWKQNNYWTPALYTKKKRKSKDIENFKHKKVFVKYKKIKDKWYLDYIKKDDSFDYVFSKYYIYQKEQARISYTTSRVLSINKIRNNNLDTIGFKNATINDVLYEMAFKYNPKFWNTYNILKSTSIQDSIIEQLEIHEPLEKQYSGRFFKNDTLKPLVAFKGDVINPYTKLTDNYYWMQDISNPQVLKYVDAENEYTRNFMKPLKLLERNLYYEMLKRTNRDTTKISDKQIVGNYEYYSKLDKGANNANIYRKKREINFKEELILDVVKKAKNNKNYWAEIIAVKPDNSVFAYIEPISGDYDTRTIFRNINTQKNIDTLYNIENIIWVKGRNEIFYTKQNMLNVPNKLLKHKIGDNIKNDKLIFCENNKERTIMISLSDDKNYLLLESLGKYFGNEVDLIDLNSANHELKQIIKFKEKSSHRISIINDTLYSLSRKNNNYFIYKTVITKPERKYWQRVIVNEKNERIESCLVLKDYFVLITKGEIKGEIKIYNKSGKYLKKVEFEKEDDFTIGFIVKNELYEKNKFQFFYTSLRTPKITYEYDIKKNTLQKISEKKIKAYNLKNYKTELQWAISKDGTKVPISIVYNKKRFKKNGKSPLYITAYSSEGVSVFPEFSSLRLSLLDRGFVYAIAHVRGGGELGEKWHEGATGLKKRNSFNDFVACTEFLIEKKYTSKGKIVASGGSAGGEVMGVAANWRPELFNTIILYVPSLDILNTLCDTTTFFSGATQGEYGNPKNRKVFDYIKSYSPYDNIKAQNYPNMLFTTGLNDTRVEYWNALKSVAKLRALKIDNNTILLKTDLYGGHSNIGYYSHYIEKAFEYAFILNNLEIKY